MKRNISPFVLKSFFALLILLAANKSFGETIVATQSGDFNLSATWGGGKIPSDLYPGDNAIIPAGITVKVSGNVTMPNLIIEAGGKLRVVASKVTITINDNLTIEGLSTSTLSAIDFGEFSVTLIVKKDLIGKDYSRIIQNPALGNTQQLILMGSSNSLQTYISSGAGRSVVAYNGTDQTVFPSPNYSSLLIGGGTKTLTPQGFNNGTITTVSKKLELKAKLKLGALDLVYTGFNDSLTYNTTGWIWTNDKGMLKNGSTENVRTFPVGDNATMKVLILSDISNTAGLTTGVRYNPTEHNVVLPQNGVGAWIINSNNPYKATVLLGNPASASTISSSPAIAFSTTGTLDTWTSLLTTKPASTTYSSEGASMQIGNNYVSFIRCSLKISSSMLAPGFQGVYYTAEYPKVSNGIAPYELTNPISSPSGFQIKMASKSEGTVEITGIPNTITTYQIGFKITDATGCQTSFNYSLEIRKPETTWDGNNWSNGEPSAGKDLILAGDYTTGFQKTLEGKSITVNAGVTLTIIDDSKLDSKSTITNNGTIIQNCKATISMTTAPVIGKPITMPAITLSPLTYGVTGQEFNQKITANISGTGATYTLVNANAVPGLILDAPTGQFSGIPANKGIYKFLVDYKYEKCSLSQQYTLSIIEPSSPNLYISPISAKTYGDADFKISAYTKNTSTPVVYTISPATACVQVLPDNILHITCAGPAPNNSVTVTAKQAAGGVYKKDSVTTTFFINKAQAKLSIKNTGFLPNAAGALIYEKSTDSLPIFTQLTGQDLATMNTDGQVTTSGSTGTFTVLVTVDATDNYTSYDSIYTFTIYATKQAPVAVNDTIVIQMGQDTTFNITLNDYGITDPVNSTLTDIDMENTGIQKKFYSTSLGTFTIDPSGLLTIKPFEGFIGTDKIAYTVTDEAGLTSQIAYLQITVEEPFKLPDLKGNEVITLNNDGLNDALVIANTNIESSNSLVVIDEAGNVIFEQDNYRNDWKGTNKKGNSIGAGVYFYVFTEKNTGRVLQNYLQIAGY